jgi:hypothetical protein
MRQLTPEGRKTLNELAQRHRFSTEAVLSMLESLLEGNGTMAQFSHPEFGGSGQWIQGGMIMLSDMFNNALKANVDGLCQELSSLLANQPFVIRPTSSQSQSQGSSHHTSSGGGQQQHSGSGPSGAVSLFVPPPAGSSGNWWPADLGMPTATGAQNNVRYAYFAGTRRLAIEINKHVTVYDTHEHQISGVSQQQSVGGSLTFTSQYGLVNVADLPVIARDGQTQPESAPLATQSDVERATTTPTQEPAPHGAPPRETDILATIERLAELKEKGVLTEEEFTAKKSELLSRL